MFALKGRDDFSGLICSALQRAKRFHEPPLMTGGRVASAREENRQGVKGDAWTPSNRRRAYAPRWCPAPVKLHRVRFSRFVNHVIRPLHRLL